MSVNVACFLVYVYTFYQFVFKFKSTKKKNVGFDKNRFLKFSTRMPTDIVLQLSKRSKPQTQTHRRETDKGKGDNERKLSDAGICEHNSKMTQNARLYSDTQIASDVERLYIPLP